MAELALLAGLSSTTATVLSAGLTAASAFSSIQAGKSEASSLKLQSQQALLNARVERLKGRQQATEISEQLNRDLASQNALFAARGSLHGEGSALAAQESAKESASRNIQTARFGSEISALNAEQRASNLRSDAKSVRRSGYLQALQTVGGFKRIPGAPGSGKPSLAG